MMAIISINCDDLENNPKCPHGPTVKFIRQIKNKVQTFYACSACRDRKECPFFLLEGEKITESKLLSWKEWRKNILPDIDHNSAFSETKRFKKISVNTRMFCRTCSCFVFPSEMLDHYKHDIKRKISHYEFKHPSVLLWPLQSSKKEAQFWFTDKAKNFLISNLCKMKVCSVINVGTPTIHEMLRNQRISSVLLDIDHRYHSFYSSKEFVWFNMFNFYFMGNENVGRESVKNVLKKPRVGLIIDPPFGARIELLARTIHKFQLEASEDLKVLLILPYFMESQVRIHLPQLKMLDYHVDYINHRKFKNSASSRKSPVRVFTNVGPHTLVFPEDDGYYFCEKCQAWRSENNKHCDSCNTCPSKNGGTYKHCNICKICVKQSWSHCIICKRCILTDHECIQNSHVSSKQHRNKRHKTVNI